MAGLTDEEKANIERATAMLADGLPDDMDQEGIPCTACGRFFVVGVDDRGLAAAVASGQLPPDVREATVMDGLDQVRCLRHRTSGELFDLFLCPHCGTYRLAKL